MTHVHLCDATCATWTVSFGCFLRVTNLLYNEINYLKTFYVLLRIHIAIYLRVGINILKNNYNFKMCSYAAINTN